MKYGNEADEKGKQSEDIEVCQNEMMKNLDVGMEKLRKLTYYLNERKVSRESLSVKCEC